MGWLAFSALATVALIAALVVWRKWISPWKDAQELADAVVAQRPPRKVLISANPEAQKVGLEPIPHLVDRSQLGTNRDQLPTAPFGVRHLHSMRTISYPCERDRHGGQSSSAAGCGRDQRAVPRLLR